MSLRSLGPMDEGLLVRYLDGVVDEDEALRLDAALATRPDARATLHALDDASTVFAGIAAAVEVPPLPELPWDRSAGRRLPFSGSGWARAAAVIVLLGIGAVAVSPAGATIAQRVAEWLGLRPAAPTAGEAVPAGTATVSFAPEGDTVRIEAITSPSSIVLDWVEGEQVTVRVDERSPVRLLVVGGGLRVETDDASPPWALRVGVPSGVSGVRLRVGQAPWQTLELPLMP